jgi:hypothetical protein
MNSITDIINEFGILNFDSIQWINTNIKIEQFSNFDISDMYTTNIILKHMSILESYNIILNPTLISDKQNENIIKSKNNIHDLKMLLTSIYEYVYSIQLLYEYINNKRIRSDYYTKYLYINSINDNKLEKIKNYNDIHIMNKFIKINDNIQKKINNLIIIDFINMLRMHNEYKIILSDAWNIIFLAIKKYNIDTDILNTAITDFFLQDYEKNYEYNEKNYELKSIYKRNIWIKLFIEKYNDTYINIFPPEWKTLSNILCELYLKYNKFLSERFEAETIFNYHDFLKYFYEIKKIEDLLNNSLCLDKKSKFIFSNYFDTCISILTNYEEQVLLEIINNDAMTIENEKEIYNSTFDIILYFDAFMQHFFKRLTYKSFYSVVCTWNNNIEKFIFKFKNKIYQNLISKNYTDINICINSICYLYNNYIKLLQIINEYYKFDDNMIENSIKKINFEQNDIIKSTVKEIFICDNAIHAYKESLKNNKKYNLSEIITNMINAAINHNFKNINSDEVILNIINVIINIFIEKISYVLYLQYSYENNNTTSLYENIQNIQYKLKNIIENKLNNDYKDKQNSIYQKIKNITKIIDLVILCKNSTNSINIQTSFVSNYILFIIQEYHSKNDCLRILKAAKIKNDMIEKIYLSLPLEFPEIIERDIIINNNIKNNSDFFDVFNFDYIINKIF